MYLAHRYDIPLEGSISSSIKLVRRDVKFTVKKNKIEMKQILFLRKENIQNGK